MLAPSQFNLFLLFKGHGALTKSLARGRGVVCGSALFGILLHLGICSVGDLLRSGLVSLAIDDLLPG